MTPTPRTRVDEIFDLTLVAERSQWDRAFLALLALQALIAMTLTLTPLPSAFVNSRHLILGHGRLALIAVAALSLVPIVLIRWRPGSVETRHAVAAVQMVWSALLIQLSGGRIETHFHVFGSLAFLAFYRDWRILLTAAAVVATGHFVRGAFWPVSVYGQLEPGIWRTLEHMAWIGFEELVLIYGCLRGMGEVRAMAEREARLEGLNAMVEREVRSKTRALDASIQASKRLVRVTGVIPWEIDAETMTVIYMSSQATKVYGPQSSSLVGLPFDWTLVHVDDRERTKRQFEQLASGEGDSHLETEFRVVTSDGRAMHLRCIVSLHEEEGQPRTLRGVTRDITGQKKLELELRHSQKLESVGRLAAGVAHEINTPVQFVSDSVHFVRDATADLTKLVQRYREILRSVIADASPAARAASQAEADADLDYALEHLPKALDRSLEGLGRVTSIVRSMKEFAHPDQRDMVAVDLNQAIRSTLVIAGHEYKYVADVVTDFGELPPVTCHVSDINQVVLNIVVNAAHAIEDVVKGTSNRGVIRVSTSREGDEAVVSISDSGGGVPDGVRERIFEPFFTTKDVGKGTGQGLALARSIVVDRHQGRLTFETLAGQGTTFHVRLPVAGIAQPEVAA